MNSAFQHEIQFRKRLKEISKNMKVLQDFYHSDVWMKGRDILYGNIQENEHFYSVREDLIWNTTQDFYIQKIKTASTTGEGTLRII